EITYADDNVRAFTNAEQTATQGIFAQLEAITNISFVAAASAEDAQLAFYVGDLEFEGVAGIAGLLPDGQLITKAHVGMDTEFSDHEIVGTYSYYALLHEMGHAVGLKHPGEYGPTDEGPFLPAEDDVNQNTVMSYFDNDDDVDTNPTTYQEFDIEALEYIYGLEGDPLVDEDDDDDDDTPPTDDDDDTLPGDDEDDTLPGDDDTIDSGEDTTDGSGGDGADVLVGSDDNGEELFGGGGADLITGAAGSDTLYGGRAIADDADGNDTIAGGDGADLIFGNTGNDSLYGGLSSGDNSGDGNDTIYAGRGFDMVDGGEGNDYLAGGGGLAHPDDESDSLIGGDGSDFIIGNGGDDTIEGGVGFETIWAGFGDDIIDGGADNDFIAGQQGNDTITGGDGIETFYFYSDNGADVITDFGGGDVVRFEDTMNGINFTSATQIYTMLQFSGTTATIDFGDGNSITFLDIERSDFSIASFEIF
ncbi:MAG: hypothetical protein MRY32_10115, partial [Rickettsiales bacterium]|nr:hypothetical protein [Rickettsiales bacterium]